MARHNKTKSSKRAAAAANPPASAQRIDSVAVREMVSGVPAGTKLRFTYKPQYTQVVFYLAGMIDAGVISVDNPLAVKLLVYAIVESGDWAYDRNRTFEVQTTDKFDVDWFVGRVGSDVESFEVVS